MGWNLHKRQLKLVSRSKLKRKNCFGLTLSCSAFSKLFSITKPTTIPESLYKQLFLLHLTNGLISLLLIINAILTYCKARKTDIKGREGKNYKIASKTRWLKAWKCILTTINTIKIFTIRFQPRLWIKKGFFFTTCNVQGILLSLDIRKPECHWG